MQGFEYSIPFIGFQEFEGLNGNLELTKEEILQLSFRLQAFANVAPVHPDGGFNGDPALVNPLLDTQIPPLQVLADVAPMQCVAEFNCDPVDPRFNTQTQSLQALTNTAPVQQAAVFNYDLVNPGFNTPVLSLQALTNVAPIQAEAKYNYDLVLVDPGSNTPTLSLQAFADVAPVPSVVKCEYDPGLVDPRFYTSTLPPSSSPLDSTPTEFCSCCVGLSSIPISPIPTSSNPTDLNIIEYSKDPSQSSSPSLFRTQKGRSRKDSRKRYKIVRWTKEEDALLKKFSHLDNWEAIARAIHREKNDEGHYRSGHAVRRRHAKLFSRDVQEDHRDSGSNKRRRRRGKRLLWTKQEDEALKRSSHFGNWEAIPQAIHSGKNDEGHTRVFLYRNQAPDAIGSGVQTHPEEPISAKGQKRRGNQPPWTEQEGEALKKFPHLGDWESMAE